MSRKETEDANTFARCKHCGRRIGRAASRQGPGIETVWAYFDVVNGNSTCRVPNGNGVDWMLNGAGEPMFHEPSLPEDLSREGVERWLES